MGDFDLSMIKSKEITLLRALPEIKIPNTFKEKRKKKKLVEEELTEGS